MLGVVAAGPAQSGSGAPAPCKEKTMGNRKMIDDSNSLPSNDSGKDVLPQKVQKSEKDFLPVGASAWTGPRATPR